MPPPAGCLRQPPGPQLATEVSGSQADLLVPLAQRVDRDHPFPVCRRAWRERGLARMGRTRVTCLAGTWDRAGVLSELRMAFPTSFCHRAPWWRSGCLIQNGRDLLRLPTGTSSRQLADSQSWCNVFTIVCYHSFVNALSSAVVTKLVPINTNFSLQRSLPQGLNAVVRLGERWMPPN